MIGIKTIAWILAAILLIPAAIAPIWYGSGDDSGLAGKLPREGKNTTFIYCNNL